MKLKYKFIVSSVSGQPVAVAVGQDNERFSGMIKLNAGSEAIFQILSEGDVSLDALLSRFASRFDIAVETARPAVLRFLDELRENGLLEADSTN